MTKIEDEDDTPVKREETLSLRRKLVFRCKTCPIAVFFCFTYKPQYETADKKLPIRLMSTLSTGYCMAITHLAGFGVAFLTERKFLAVNFASTKKKCLKNVVSSSVLYVQCTRYEYNFTLFLQVPFGLLSRCTGFAVGWRGVGQGLTCTLRAMQRSKQAPSPISLTTDHFLLFVRVVVLVVSIINNTTALTV